MKYFEKTAFYCADVEEMLGIIEHLKEHDKYKMNAHKIKEHSPSSDCLSVDGEKCTIGHCFRKWYEEKGYTILNASDILKKTLNYEIY